MVHVERWGWGSGGDNLFLQGYGYRGILKEENENNVKWEEVKKEARNIALLRIFLPEMQI